MGLDREDYMQKKKKNTCKVFITAPDTWKLVFQKGSYYYQITETESVKICMEVLDKA